MMLLQVFFSFDVCITISRSVYSVSYYTEDIKHLIMHWVDIYERISMRDLQFTSRSNYNPGIIIRAYPIVSKLNIYNYN